MILRLILGLGLTGVCVLPADAEDPPEPATPAVPLEAVEHDPWLLDLKVRDRQEAVTQELKSLKDHFWAGHYSWGDGFLGVHVSLAPRSGLAYTRDGCVGLYEQNHGSVTETGNTLRVKFEMPTSGRFDGADVELRIVRWGERRYLVRTSELLDFCNFINSGYPGQVLLLRNGDENKPAPDRPDLPREYLAKLLDKPLPAKVTSLGKTTVQESRSKRLNRYRTTVTLDVGRKQGAWQGMDFYFNEAESITRVKVIELQDDSCMAVMEETGDKPTKPAIGWKVSTLWRYRQTMALSDE